MKKIIVIVIGTLFMGLQSKAQKPILPYGEHSKDTIKKFARSNTPLAKSWRDNLLPYLQSKLLSAGKVVVFTASNTDWILDSTEIVERKIKTFRNSSRYDNVVKFDKLLDHNFEGYVGVFHYQNIQIIIFKANCLNLLQVEDEVIQTIPFIPPAKKEEEKKVDTPKVVPKVEDGPEYTEDISVNNKDNISRVPQKPKLKMGEKVEPEFTRREDWSRRAYNDYPDYYEPKPNLFFFVNLRTGGQGGNFYNPPPQRRPYVGGTRVVRRPYVGN